VIQYTQLTQHDTSSYMHTNTTCIHIMSESSWSWWYDGWIYIYLWQLCIVFVVLKLKPLIDFIDISILKSRIFRMRNEEEWYWDINIKPSVYSFIYYWTCYRPENMWNTACNNHSISKHPVDCLQLNLIKLRAKICAIKSIDKNCHNSFRSLTCREHDTFQTCYPLWSMIRLSLLERVFWFCPPSYESNSFFLYEYANDGPQIDRWRHQVIDKAHLTFGNVS
jgi:hypothetical protein